jgi:hypothetical protein
VYSAAEARDKTRNSRTGFILSGLKMRLDQKGDRLKPVLHKSKRHRVLNASVAIYFPRLDGVEVTDDRVRLLKEVRLDAPEFGEFDDGRLHFSLIVGGAGLQNSFRAIPLPGETKSGMCLGISRALHFCGLPVAAAIGGHLDFRDGAAARPC